jgi:hypothetical protein
VGVFRNIDLFFLNLFELVAHLLFDAFLEAVHKVDVEHVQVAGRLEVGRVLDDHDGHQQTADALDGGLVRAGYYAGDHGVSLEEQQKIVHPLQNCPVEVESRRKLIEVGF